MAKHLLGKEVNEALVGKLRQRTEELRQKGVAPKLAIVRCGEKPSDISYEKGATKKAETVGVETMSVVLPGDVTKEELIGVIDGLNRDDSVHGVLLFRPLPKHLKPYDREICNHLRAAKDVDGMTDLSNAGVYEDREIGFPPCTARACLEILDFYGIDPEGRNVVVIGRSLVIGKPVAMLLMARNATVTVCHTRTTDVPGIARKADILVTSAGCLGVVTKDYVRPGQVVIDVSVNWDPAKKDWAGGIAGDAVFEEVEPVVGAITPVPGGVGAVTTTVLIGHVITAAERLSSRKK